MSRGVGIRLESVSSESMNLKNLSLVSVVLLGMSLGSCKNRKPPVVKDNPEPTVISIESIESEYAKSEDDLANLIISVIKSPESFSDLGVYMATVDVVRKLEPDFTKGKSDGEVDDRMLQPSIMRMKENFEKLNVHLTDNGVDLSQLELLNINRESVEVESEEDASDVMSIDLFQLDLADKSNMFSAAFTTLGQGKDLYMFELIITYPQVKPRG